MQKTKHIGSDCGNDALKLYLKEPNYEGQEKLEVMNIVSQGHDRRILGEDKGHLVNLLDVTITQGTEPMGRYFVGGLAYKENHGDSIEKNKRDIKAKNKDTIILMVTGLAYALYDPQAPVKTENIAVGTLLPTEEYWNDGEDLVEYLNKELLKKQYKVKFNAKPFKNAEITINFVDTDVLPESAAGHLAALYNMDGSVQENVKIDNEIHLGIFIGSITTEISVYDNGKFSTNGFLGIPLGTSDPLDKIIDDLKIDISRHRIDHIIRNKKELKVNINGELHDYTAKLEECSKSRFDYFVRQLVNQINRKLVRQGINIDLITNVNIGGGGGITTYENLVKELNIGNVKLIDDARFANAKGALYSIVQKNIEPMDEILDEEQLLNK
ncbi:hypothetical protein [Clostridium saccharoperbutylacetonicum]|uniref:hypothetical protein n=1 Tax=Clostridium saccharoperbutylacetonicum TaxID=36745 RepID=UPI0039EBE707